jgi:HD-GYP domain-containing protein (c-di-GMP phosphodiesterase class II)
VNQFPYVNSLGPFGDRAPVGAGTMTPPHMPGTRVPRAITPPPRRGVEGQSPLSIRIGLARAVDAKDPSTRRHSERVADLSWVIADALGWSTSRRTLLHEAALVHDLGKIAIPDEILFKPDELTPHEYETVKGHSRIGAEMLEGVMTSEQVSWVRCHHEWWGGGGYPDGLVGAQIPEGARVIAVADAWDAITSWRPYGGPRSTAQALEECRLSMGTQFWPPAVIALGSAVQSVDD